MRVLRRFLAAAALFAGAALATADNCGSEEDCRAVPQNVDTATGIAAAGAAAGVLISLAGNGRRRDPEPTTTFDPGAGETPPEEPPEEGTGTTGSVEDLFGGGGADGGSADTPPEPGPDGGETSPDPDEPPETHGPPDGPLGDPDDLGDR